MIWLKVSVPNRIAPLHFVLDTGAGTTVLNLNAVEALDLKRGQPVRVQGIGGTAAAYRIRGFRGSLHGIALPGNVLALDLSPIGRTCHREIDGILGADFLRSHVVQIDCVSAQLNVGASCKPISPEATILPLKFINDAFCVSASVNNGQPAWLRVDTGYDGGVSWWPSDPEPRGIQPRAPRSSLAVASSGDSTVSADLHLGGLTIFNAELALQSRPFFEGEAGLLGMKALSNYRVTIEVPRKRLVLEPLPR